MSTTLQDLVAIVLERVDAYNAAIREMNARHNASVGSTVYRDFSLTTDSALQWCAFACSETSYDGRGDMWEFCCEANTPEQAVERLIETIERRTASVEADHVRQIERLKNSVQERSPFSSMLRTQTIGHSWYDDTLRAPKGSEGGRDV